MCFPCRKCFAFGRKWKWQFWRLLLTSYGIRARSGSAVAPRAEQLLWWARYREKNPQLSGKQFHINRPTYFMLTLKFNVITPARSRGNKASWGEGWNEALWQDGEVLWPSARGEAVITHHRVSREAEDLFSPQITHRFRPLDEREHGGILLPLGSIQRRSRSTCVQPRKSILESSSMPQVKIRARSTAWKLKWASPYQQMNTGATDAMNFPFLENFLLSIFLAKVAGDMGLQGGNEWGRNTQTPLPTTAPRAAEIAAQTPSHRQKATFKFHRHYWLYPTCLI